MSTREEQAWSDVPEQCRFGRQEHDMARYCFEHGGFLEYMSGYHQCHQVQGRKLQMVQVQRGGRWVQEVSYR